MENLLGSLRPLHLSPGCCWLALGHGNPVELGPGAARSGPQFGGLYEATIQPGRTPLSDHSPDLAVEWLLGVASACPLDSRAGKAPAWGRGGQLEVEGRSRPNHASSSGLSLLNKKFVTRHRVCALLRQWSPARPASPLVYFLTPPLFLVLTVAHVKLYDIPQLSQPTLVHQWISPILGPLVATKISAFSAQRIKNTETEFGRKRKRL